MIIITISKFIFSKIHVLRTEHDAQSFLFYLNDETEEDSLAKKFKELQENTIKEYVSNVYVGDDKKIHVEKDGADTALNFSSGYKYIILGSSLNDSNRNTVSYDVKNFDSNCKRVIFAGLQVGGFVGNSSALAAGCTVSTSISGTSFTVRCSRNWGNGCGINGSFFAVYEV